MENTTTTITYQTQERLYDLSDDSRLLEVTGDMDMENSTIDIQEITVGVAGIPVDEFRDRVKPDAETTYQLAPFEVEAVYGEEACPVAQEAMPRILDNMLTLLAEPRKAWYVGRTIQLKLQWDPTTRPVKYNGNGSDRERNGAMPRPFNWRIAANLLKVKDKPKYWRTMKEVVEANPWIGYALPPGFLDDPPKSEKEVA